MMGIDDFLLGIVGNLIASSISPSIEQGVMSAFQRRKIKRRVDEALCEVVEPIIPFLKQEKLTQNQQRLLIEACRIDLQELADNPQYLFQGSLDGQKIFDNLYSGEGKKLPDVVIDEKLEGVYSLLFPRIATVICKIPAAVKDWENEAWKEDYRRLDEIASELRALFEKVDTLDKRSNSESDRTLQLVRRFLAQKLGLKLDITGLRSDKPTSGKLNDFFVHPELKYFSLDLESIKNHVSTNRTTREHLFRSNFLDATPYMVIGESDESFNLFTHQGIKVIVEGGPGSGKSTWSKWLQREIVTRENWSGIAIRIELRDLITESLPPLSQMIRDSSNPNMSEEITSKKIRNWLDDQKIIFILDGFDEVAPKNRNIVQDWILDLENAAQGCSFILTSRPLTTSHLEDFKSNNWDYSTVEPFDQVRIIDYIQRWYKHCELLSDSVRNIDANDLSNQWQNDPTIEPLTGNPLMLSTLLMVHHLDGELPRGRSELYKRYVKGMLGIWDDRRNVQATDIQLMPQQKEQLLRGIALYLHLEEKDKLDEDEMGSVVQNLLQDLNISFNIEKVLEVLRERTGLIIGPGIYSFVHKSVSEYFVAETIFQGNQKEKNGNSIDRLTLLSHREDDRWKTVIFLWAGLASEHDLISFIEACIVENGWTLAYGLLYDQYEKISPRDRKQLLIDSLNDFNIELGKNSGGFYCYACPRNLFNENALQFPDLDLESLVGVISLSNLLRRAIYCNELKCSDVHNTPKNLRFLIWTIYATYYENFDEWKSCIDNLISEFEIQEEWNFYILERVLFRVCGKEINTLDIKGVFDILQNQNHVKDYQGIATFYLLWLFCENSLYALANRSFIINNLITLISKQAEVDIDLDWLKATTSWTDEMREINGEEDVDILITSLKILESLYDDHFIESKEDYQLSMQLIQKLLKMRETLTISSPANY
jgi:adenylate kinase family enzyme